MQAPCRWLVLAWVLSANVLLAAESPEVAALRKKAEAGDAVAQDDLGMQLHAKGRGTPENMAEGLGWFRKAAAQGLIEGEYHLGMALASPAENPAEAMRWLLKAANQGHARPSRWSATCT